MVVALASQGWLPSWAPMQARRSAQTSSAHCVAAWPRARWQRPAAAPGGERQRGSVCVCALAADEGGERDDQCDGARAHNH
jgi:hypothetical protein